MSNYIAQALVGEPEVVEESPEHRRHRHRRVHRPRRRRREQPGVAAPQAAPRRAAGRAGAGRLGPGRRRPRGCRGARRRDRRRPSRELAPLFPHDAAYLDALVADFERWARATGFGVPDFYDSLMAFQPQQHRVDGIRHLVVFPMYTQNGSANRLVEAVLVEVIWPEFIAELEAGDYTNKLFVPMRFLDFTARLRHELGRALPRDRRDARDPDVHVGRDLPGPRGGPLPPGRARGSRDHQARTARRTPQRCSTTSS